MSIPYDLLFVLSVAAIAWLLNKEPRAPRTRDEWRQR